MQTVLSLDLDFFVNPRVTNPSIRQKRASSKTYKPWSIQCAIDFLENKCCLSKLTPIVGSYGEEHSEIYDSLDAAIEKQILTAPFQLIHLDAHFDIGMGGSSFRTIMVDILGRPISQRCIGVPRGKGGMNSACWLAFCISNRWISEIVFPKHPYWRDDINWFYKKGNNIQLKMLSDEQYKHLIDLKLWGQGSHDYFNNISTNEPLIHLEMPYIEQFKISDSPDLMFACKSPQYTPKTADYLFDQIISYINNKW